MARKGTNKAKRKKHKLKLKRQQRQAADRQKSDTYTTCPAKSAQRKKTRT